MIETWILRAGLITLTAATLGAWEEKLSREGSYWVQTVTGTESAAQSGKLRVSTQGRISVVGVAEDHIRYAFTKRVKARNESDARRRLGQFVIKSYRQGDITTIGVAHGAEGNVDLQVSAPRGLRELYLETHGGEVEATGLDGALQAHTGGGRIKLDRIGGQVLAKTAGGEIVLGTIGGSVKCISAGGPIRAETIRGGARFETAGGDIVAREVAGAVTALTAGGGIQIGKAGATVSVNTAGGVIEIGSARGMVTAQSQGGPIQVGAAAGVKCETGGGAITLSNISGALRASTAVGNIIARLLLDNAEDSYLGTGGGDITVFLPSNLGITIQAQNESGQSLRQIVCDFPAVKVRRQGSMVVAEGEINGGGPVLRLAGAGGTIFIRRQK